MMSLNLSQLVADQCAEVSSMDLVAWVQKNPLPAFIQPKLDGRRVWFVRTMGGNLVMATKHNGIYTKETHPETFAEIPKDTTVQTLIADCEFVPAKNEIAIFDVINVDGKDMRKKPLTERISVLAELAQDFHSKNIHVLPCSLAETPGKILQLFYEHLENGYEGIVVKRASSLYGEPNSWLKLKKHDTLDCVIIDRNAEREGFSWFIGIHDSKGKLVELGRVGSYVKSVNPEQIQNGTVVEVRYQELTKEMRLRHPYILRIRDDKIPAECRLPEALT